MASRQPRSSVSASAYTEPRPCTLNCASHSRHQRDALSPFWGHRVPFTAFTAMKPSTSAIGGSRRATPTQYRRCTVPQQPQRRCRPRASTTDSSSAAAVATTTERDRDAAAIVDDVLMRIKDTGEGGTATWRHPSGTSPPTSAIGPPMPPLNSTPLPCARVPFLFPLLSPPLHRRRHGDERAGEGGG